MAKHTLEERVFAQIHGSLGLLDHLADAPRRAASLKAAQASIEILMCEAGCAPVADTREAATRALQEAVAVLTGDDVGVDQIPARYDTGDRETLDRIRDLLPGPVGFASGCLFNVVKYLDRAGKKGSAEQDEAKALFYLQAAGHVLVGLPDPRRGRQSFNPWAWSRTTVWPARLYDLLDRLDGMPAGQGREAWKAMLMLLHRDAVDGGA